LAELRGRNRTAGDWEHFEDKRKVSGIFRMQERKRIVPCWKFEQGRLNWDLLLSLRAGVGQYISNADISVTDIGGIYVDT
jgi:hypothetical protein